MDIAISAFERLTNYLCQLDIPVLNDMGDSYALNYLNSFSRTHSKFWKIIYWIDYHRLFSYEKKIIEQTDHTFLFNRREVDYFNSPKVQLIHHGVDTQLLEYDKFDSRYKNSVVFFGKMSYQSNIDAVIWFAENVLLHLPQEMDFLIVGAEPKRRLFKLAKENSRVKVLGFVEDPFVILRSCLCVVAPMFGGSGIQNKILQSMAVGSLVVSSPYAAYPIVGNEKDIILTASEPDEWIWTIQEIRQDPEKFKPLRERARNHIKNNFTWEIYWSEYSKVLERLLNSRK